MAVTNGAGHGRLNILRYFLSGIFGFRKKRHAVCLKASKLEVIVNDNLTWDIDGERGPVGNVKIECLHNHLSIFVPKKKK